MLSGCNNLVKNNMNPQDNTPSPSNYNNSIDPNKQDQHPVKNMFLLLDGLVDIHRTNINITITAIKTKLPPLQLGVTCLRNSEAVINSILMLIDIVDSTPTNNDPIVGRLNHIRSVIEDFKNLIEGTKSINSESIKEYKIFTHEYIRHCNNMLESYKTTVFNIAHSSNEDFYFRIDKNNQMVYNNIQTFRNDFDVSIEQFMDVMDQFYEMFEMDSETYYYITTIMYTTSLIIDNYLPVFRDFYNRNRGSNQEYLYNFAEETLVRYKEQMIANRFHYIMRGKYSTLPIDNIFFNSVYNIQRILKQVDPDPATSIARYHSLPVTGTLSPLTVSPEPIADPSSSVADFARPVSIPARSRSRSLPLPARSVTSSSSSSTPEPWIRIYCLT